MLPSARSWLTFDLVGDPYEWNPEIESDRRREVAEEVREWYAAHRYSSEGLEWSERRLFDGNWICKDGGPCRRVRPKPAEDSD